MAVCTMHNVPSTHIILTLCQPAAALSCGTIAALDNAKRSGATMSLVLGQ